MNFIFDTSSAILLFEKCNLRKELLNFSETNNLYVPTRVMEEYIKGENVKSSDIIEFQKIFSVISPTLKTVLLPYFNNDSSSGEIWVISYALENPECCCVIDEEFGRNIATLFETKLTGAIGIMKKLKSQNLMSDDDLRQLRAKVGKSGFYLSKKLLKELDEICSSHQT